MQERATSAEPNRPRIDFTLATDALAWAQEHVGPALAFTSDSHAMEQALARLRDEHGFVRAQCRRQRIPFTAKAFWSLYEDEIAKSTPSKRGPRTVDTPPRQTRKVVAGVSAEVLRWVDQNCASAGPFETPSHAVETGLRHLQAVEAPQGRRVAGSVFPFDADAVWQSYLQAVKS